MEPQPDPGDAAAAPAGIADLLPVGVLVADAEAAAHFANRTWTELTGQGDGDWRLHGWLDAEGHDEREARRSAILDTVRSGTSYAAEWKVRGVDEERDLKVVAVPDLVDGELASIVVTASDVTAERARTDDLLRRATHDGLTGLYNRLQFAGFVEHALDRRRRDPRLHAAVIFVDVDDLKATNDVYGHDAGDRLLQTVADRITAAVRPGDVVARYGGDEFAVLCEDLRDGAEGIAIADRVREAVRRPYDGDGACSASVGVAAADGHVLVGDILRAADRSMYRAKGSHGRDPSAGTHRTRLPPSRLAIAARDLQGPLTAIMDSAALLRRWGDDLPTSDARAAIELIEHMGQTLTNVLDDVLDIATSDHRQAST